VVAEVVALCLVVVAENLVVVVLPDIAQLLFDVVDLSGGASSTLHCLNRLHHPCH
jgi:uncharacterized protein YjeT (DUF2065 family)